MAKNPTSGTQTSGSTTTKMVKSGNAVKGTLPKRESLQSLRRDVEAIVSRLKQADNLTQKSITSLQTAFSVLEKRVSEDSKVSKEALTERVDQLSAHLSAIIDKTHKDVAKDLASAKANPTVERLAQAVRTAEERMAKAELVQAEALSKVNRHLAGMAKAIDAKFNETAAAQKTQLQLVSKAVQSNQQQTESKLSAIEQASADAIRSIGEKVAQISDDLRERGDKNVEALHERISSVSGETQRNFDTYRSDLENYRSQFERRVEGLEETQGNLDSYTDRSIAKLTARIDNLEYGLTHIAPPPSPGEGSSANASTISVSAAAPVIDDPFEPLAPENEDLVLENSISELGDTSNSQAANSPVPFQPSPAPRLPASPSETPGIPQPTQPAAVETIAPLQSITPPLVQKAADTASPVQEPPLQEPLAPVGSFKDFGRGEPSPAAALANAYTDKPDSMAPTELGPVPAIVDPNAHYANVAPETSFDAANPAQQPMPGMMPTTPPLGMPGHHYAVLQNPNDIKPEDLPYEDPAYAENQSADGMQRPGSFKKKAKANGGKKKFSLPKLKLGEKPNVKLPNKKVQIAAGAALLLTVGYLALSSGAEESGSPDAFAKVADGSATPIATIPKPDVSLPAIGDYPDNKAGTPIENEAQAGTLEAAVQSGNPIAEFQLGLSHLQAGRKDQAIDLIRSSANKGQAAAQYRLAKLYESGDGVTADAAMARQLTERAARNGNRIAMHDLALYYAEGRGDVDVNIETAAKWFEKAAQRGVVDSQYNLGVLFESGQGLPRNLTEAYVWYSIAAAQGDDFARKHITVLKNQINDSDVKRAQNRVAEFKPVSIDEEANGIFRNLAWAQAEKSMPQSTRSLVAETQKLLGELGYDAGRPDGAVGPKTRAAVRSFQRSQGLSQTGKIDQALMSQLQRASGA